VDVVYPGASPKEVEKGVVIRVEEAVREIEGISEMKSFSREGYGSVSIEVGSGYDLTEVMDEVKMAVDRISSFPVQIENPRIYKSQMQMDAIRVQVYGDLDEKSMKMFAEQIRDEILDLPAVTSASLAGARPYEISLELKEAKLRQYGLTLERVAQAVRNSSLDLPAGSIKTESGDILLRTQGQAYEQQDFERIVLLTRRDGTRLTLSDIADVTDGFAEIEFFALFDEKTSVGVSVFAVGDQNQMEIAQQVKDYVEERRLTLPDAVQITTWADSAYYLDATLDMMLDNLAFGIVLVFVILGLFLRMQLAFWVIVGLPVCFLGAFAMLPFTTVSINMISLFGFILVLGIVVDDAIIIGESAQTVSEREGHSVNSVILGAKRVAIPGTFGVLTTIVAFFPMLMVEGPFSAFPESIAYVVVLCLAFSLVESKLILPAHLAHMKPLPDIPREEWGPVRRMQTWFADGLRHVIHHVYRPLLTRAIHHRYTTLAIFVGLLIVSVSVVFSPFVKIVVFPSMPSDFLMAQVELVDGAPTSQTVKIVKTLTDNIRQLNDEYPPDQQFLQHIVSYTDGVVGRIMVEVSKGEEREISAEVLAQRWRAMTGDVPGTKKLQITGSVNTGGGQTFSFELLGNNPPQLEAAARELEEKLRSYNGVFDIENSSKSSMQEINLKIRPSAEALGLTLSDLARQVRAAFHGIEAQRIQRGRDEIRVMVRYPRDERRSVGNLESMFIRTPQGVEVPFHTVADVELQESYSDIVRSNGKRVIIISADANKERVQPGVITREITTSFAAELKQRYPEVTLELGGSSRREQELMWQTFYNFCLALFTIYALMAIPLRSYVQPLIIMGVIPFGMIGALVGHLLVGIPFSALSIFGIVALAGVVVNDSIIMVDYVNKSVEGGKKIFDAAVTAGTQRFRAIMLTSLTTFFGLLPMLMEETLSAQFVIPMAVSLGFGIVFATVITLLLVPCLYLILDDFNLSRWVVTKDVVREVVN
jgi:multidrug efflux pump subunit AcrB